jgi:hypothetical protein
LVLLGEFAVPFQDGVQTCAERGVRGSLGYGNQRCGGATSSIAEPFDLGADVGLGVKPRAGDAGVACHLLERDSRSCAVEFT